MIAAAAAAPEKPLPDGARLDHWCLLALHTQCDPMPDDQVPGGTPLDQARHRGPPPLRFACIAPYCPEWQPSSPYGDGYCNYCRQLATLDTRA